MTDLERIIYILNLVPLYKKYTIDNMVNLILPAYNSNQYVIVVIPWIIDCVAPYGGVFAELRNKESQSVKALKAAGVKGKIQYFRQKGKKRTLHYAMLP